MQHLRRRLQRSHPARRGAALLMSMLVLFVLVALVFQISVTAQTDARTARNEVNLTTMDLTCESALLQVEDKLRTDGEATGADAAPAATPPAGNAGDGQTPAPPTGAQPGAAQGQEASVDSRRDEWAQPQRTEINEIKLRIFVQDEDSKYNVLNMLNPDEKEAEAAFARVAKILDKCRDGTTADIEENTAQQMAKAMLEHMTKRKASPFPRDHLLTDDEKNEDLGLPLSLREFMVLKPFDESHFRDFRDDDGKVVHTIESFLTVWSSLESSAEMQTDRSAATPPATTGRTGTQPTNRNASNPLTPNANNAAAPATTPETEHLSKSETNGFGVNVNTAPAAVLKSLFDDRELQPRFWDEVIKYRNLEEEKKEGEPEEDPADAPLDEYGRPILKRRIFEQLAEIQEVDGWEALVPAVQDKLNQLCSTQSHVFMIYVVARRSTAQEGDVGEAPESARDMRLEEERGDSLMRVVRAVVWRTKRKDQVVIVPVVRWEVLDFLPHEVLDYPDEER